LSTHPLTLAMVELGQMSRLNVRCSLI